MTNGNVHPLKNRMKVNIFSFYSASVQLILIQLAMSTLTKFEIRHRIHFAIKLLIIDRKSNVVYRFKIMEHLQLNKRSYIICLLLPSREA